MNRNYAGQILQNRSFKRLNLTGADFSGSDLRGCDFTEATLVGASFVGARTGQSREQVKRSVVVATVAPAVIIGFSLLVAQVPTHLFGDRLHPAFDFLIRALPLLALLFEILFRDSMTHFFPHTTNLLGVSGVAVLFQLMAVFTLGLVIISIFSFGDGSGAQGLFLLVLAGISALITHRCFKWVVQAIQSSGGTSFRKANLTQADWSQTVVQNTDFNGATLTGICIFDWVIQRHTHFENVDCQYVYLEPARQKRHPTKGNFRLGEVGPFLLKATELSTNQPPE